MSITSVRGGVEPVETGTHTPALSALKIGRKRDSVSTRPQTVRANRLGSIESNVYTFAAVVRVTRISFINALYECFSYEFHYRGKICFLTVYPGGGMAA